MAMIVYSGDIPLLFWHLNLSADSVGQPERGTLEAQGDEKIDQGDEEARKGENIFKKKHFDIFGLQERSAMLTRLKLLRLQREMMETREKKMFEMRGKTILDPREKTVNLKEENMIVTAHVGNIQSIFIWPNQDVLQIGIQHFQNTIYQQKQRALSLTTGLDYRLHQDFFNFHPQNQSQKTQAFKNTKESIKKWTKDFGECCRDLDKTS